MKGQRYYFIMNRFFSFSFFGVGKCASPHLSAKPATLGMYAGKFLAKFPIFFPFFSYVKTGPASTTAGIRHAVQWADFYVPPFFMHKKKVCPKPNRPFIKQ